jgi:hypothetical protein
MALENYWRALGRTSLDPPLFLHLFQRNLTILGQTPAEPNAVAEAPQRRDIVSESLWPVLARLLQFRAGDILSTDKGPEWLVGSAILLASAMRQMGVMMERVRDNDLAFEVETQFCCTPEKRRNRRTASVIRCCLGLMLFLFFLEITQQTRGPAQIAAGSAAAVLAILVSIMVARID